MKKHEIELIVETAPGQARDSLAVALAVAHDLRTTEVEEWAARVQAIIDDCRRLREAEEMAQPVDPDAEERRRIEAEIEHLQRQLKQFDTA
jgi:hypothetical protein